MVYRYSAFYGVPAAYHLPRRFADLEGVIFRYAPSGKQQDINWRLKIQPLKGVFQMDTLEPLSDGVSLAHLIRIQVASAEKGVPTSGHGGGLADLIRI